MRFTVPSVLAVLMFSSLAQAAVLTTNPPRKLWLQADLVEHLAAAADLSSVELIGCDDELHEVVFNQWVDLEAGVEVEVPDLEWCEVIITTDQFQFTELDGSIVRSSKSETHQGDLSAADKAVSSIELGAVLTDNPPVTVIVELDEE